MYTTFSLAFEGFGRVVLRGLIYGLVLLFLIWGASEILAWGTRALKRRLAQAQPTAAGELKLSRIHGTDEEIASEETKAAYSGNKAAT